MDGGTRRKNQERIMNIRIYWLSAAKQQGIKSSVKRAVWTRGQKGDELCRWGDLGTPWLWNCRGVCDGYFESVMLSRCWDHLSVLGIDATN